MVVVDANRRVINGTPDPAFGRAAYSKLLDRASAAQQATGMVPIGGPLFQFAVVPVPGPQPIGWVVAGFEVNDAVDNDKLAPTYPPKVALGKSDDYGTGHSSLAYLRRLPLDELKVDKAFIRGMATDAGDALIVRSTIELAHKPGLVVSAAGIEDEGTLDRLRELGCDSVQGFLLSRPLAADGVASGVRESAWARPVREKDSPPRVR